MHRRCLSSYLLANDTRTLICFFNSLFGSSEISKSRKNLPKRPQKNPLNQLLTYFLKRFLSKKRSGKNAFFEQEFHFLNIFAEAFEEKILQYGKTTPFWSKTGVPDWTKIRRQIMTLRQDDVIDCVIISDPVHYHVRGDRNSCTFGAPSPAGPFK